MRRRIALRRTWLLRGIAAALLAVTFGYVPYHLYARSGLARYLQVRDELRALRAQDDRIRIENERLARQVEWLRSDMRAVERAARVELGWVRPGEVVFELGSQSKTGGGDEGR